MGSRSVGPFVADMIIRKFGVCAVLAAEVRQAAVDEDWSGIGELIGRNTGPRILELVEVVGLLTDRALALHLASVWAQAEFPCRELRRHRWLRWFRTAALAERAGFAEDQTECWRSQVGRTIGLSWTTNRDTALWFQWRNRKFGFQPRLLRALVPRRAVLACVDGNEHEVVLDVPVIRRRISEDRAKGWRGRRRKG